MVSEEERQHYEECCKFKPSKEAIEVSLQDDGDDTDRRFCETEEDVAQAIAEFEAEELTAEEVKEILRETLHNLGTYRIASGGSQYATMTTPVKTASLHELTEGAKAAIKQESYEARARANALAAGKAPKPPCEDKQEDCGFFATEGECENNAEWMLANCPKACGRCVDESAFFEAGFVVHIQGKKGLGKFRKRDSKAVVMFWKPDCKYCAAAKPQCTRPSQPAAAAPLCLTTLCSPGRADAEAAETAAETLSDVVFAGVDCSRNEALCVKQGIDSFPTFKFFRGADDWKKDGEPVKYDMETNPADPSVLGTTTFLSEQYDEELMAEWDDAPAEDEL